MAFEERMETLYSLGPVAAGVLFGSGWCVWMDAVLCSAQKTPAVYFLPGCAATLTLVMINCVRRDELGDDSDYDGLGNQKRAWLFFSYLASFACLGGAIASLVTHFDKTGNDQAVGVAGVVQTVLITASALLFWVTRSPASDY